MTEDRSPEERTRELDRRAFLRRAGMTGLAAAWVAPVVQSIAATPAYAQTVGQTPVPDDCFHSVGGETGAGCMGACTASGCGGSACDGKDDDPCNPNYGGEGPCQYFCPSAQGGDNPCCNPELCVVGNFECLTIPNCEDQGPKFVKIAVYKGSLEGCPPVPPPP
jgi:hypothetical protein